MVNMNSVYVPCVAKAKCVVVVAVVVIGPVATSYTACWYSCGDLLRCCSRGDGVNMRCNAIMLGVVGMVSAPLATLRIVSALPVTSYTGV